MIFDINEMRNFAESRKFFHLSNNKDILINYLNFRIYQASSMGLFQIEIPILIIREVFNELKGVKGEFEKAGYIFSIEKNKIFISWMKGK